MSQRSVVILSGVRTAIGDYGGSLKDIAPTDLGARAVREAIARAKEEGVLFLPLYQSQGDDGFFFGREIFP